MAKKRGKKRNTKDVKPQHELPGGFWRQVVAVLMIVIAVILIFTWFGEGGNALNNIHEGMQWLIGRAVFMLPVLLVYLAIKIFRSETNELPVAIWVASILMVVWGAGISEVIEAKTGGILGAGLNAVVTQILEPGVAIFIYIVLIFITLIFMLQVSPLAVFRGFAGIFRNTKKSEDVKNAQVMKAVEKGEGAAMDIKINGHVAAAKAAQPVMKVNKAGKTEPAPVVESKALVSVDDPNWKMPGVELLEKNQSPPDPGNVNQNAYIIRSTFADFGIDMEMGDANVGPRVTQYTMRPPSGIDLGKILKHDKELALNLAVASNEVRVEAPIPGTRLVGVELPNVKQGAVTLRSILDSPEWKKATEPLTFAVGKDIAGKAVVANLAKMPHLLVAGTTGSGKSVMTNTLITSLLYRNSPADLKMIIVDPKQVEMVQYQDIPHLLTPIVNSTEKALSAMKWAVDEMEKRYTLMSEERVKKIEDYNSKIAKKSGAAKTEGEESEQSGGKMPYIVIVIDEMADLMMQAGKDLEMLIVRIAQKGRAAGMHLVLATQRPEVKVITGLIKANVPGRIAFAVKSNVDSRIMLDQSGAEKLLGKGDMLLLTTEMMGKAYRIQGAFTSDNDIEKVTEFLKEQRPPEYNDDVIAQPVQIKGLSGGIGGGMMEGMGRQYDPNDPVVRKAIEITLKQGKFSTASLQTWLGKGHGFVAGLAIWLEELGVIGPSQGNKPRDVLISSMEEFDQLANM